MPEGRMFSDALFNVDWNRYGTCPNCCTSCCLWRGNQCYCSLGQLIDVEFVVCDCCKLVQYIVFAKQRRAQNVKDLRIRGALPQVLENNGCLKFLSVNNWNSCENGQRGREQIFQNGYFCGQINELAIFSHRKQGNLC